MKKHLLLKAKMFWSCVEEQNHGIHDEKLKI